MSQQLSTPRRTVAVAAAFVVVSLILFGVAFWVFGGMRYVEPVIAQISSLLARQPSTSPEVTSPPESEPSELSLPKGMPEDFALRLWQEQLDSQEVIGRLVAGEIASLELTGVEQDGDEAAIGLVARSKDGAAMRGKMGLRRYDDVWYASWVTAERDGSAPPPSTDLPGLEDIDVDVLNAVLAEQRKSRPVSDQMVDGSIMKLTVDSIDRGPQTATIHLSVTGGSVRKADLVVIEQEVGGTTYQFLARFNAQDDGTQ